MCTVVWQERGQSPAAGVVEDHRDSFSNEVMLEMGLERWIGSVVGAQKVGRERSEEGHSQKD